MLVDRDPALLVRLTGDLERSGFLVESLCSTDGLTPDLLALSAPDWLVMDEGLPGLTRAALLVLVRSMKSRLPFVQVAVVAEREVAAAEADYAVDRAVPRELLVREGGPALQLGGEAPPSVDVRSLIDDLLGTHPQEQPRVFEVSLDMFGESNLYVDGSGRVEGVFASTSVLPAIGNKVSLKVNVLGRKSFTVEGEVAWQRTRASFGNRVPTGVGVRLQSPSEELRLSLDRFVDLREPLVWAS